MKVMIEFATTDLQQIKNLRTSYFFEIKLSQELFIEWMISKSSCFKIYDDSHEIGYFIINPEGILLEFYLITEYLNEKERIFSQIIAKHSAIKVYCKSFDQVLLTCSHTFSRASFITGTIFRDYNKSIHIDYENQFKPRLAKKSDIPALLLYEDSELFQSPEELEFTVSNRMLFMFEKEGVLIGCGYLIKVLPEKIYYDIAVWTNPRFRQKGFGTMIISYLKRHCFSHGYTPVCGCAVENSIARKVLERNGFIAKHCIIEFSLQKRIY